MTVDTLHVHLDQGQILCVCDSLTPRSPRTPSVSRTLVSTCCSNLNLSGHVEFLRWGYGQRTEVGFHRLANP